MAATATHLASTATSLRASAECLAGIDPERLWKHLEELAKGIEDARSTLVSEIVETGSEHAADHTRLSREVKGGTDDLSSRIEALGVALESGFARVNVWLIVVLLVGIAALILSIYSMFPE
jgi:hypothetical protein